MKKFGMIVLVLLLLVAIASGAGAAVERTLEQRVTDLEARVDACGCPVDPAADLSLPAGLQTQAAGSTVAPGSTTTPPPVVEPTTAPAEPTAAPEPEPTKKPHCNQGLGNGQEGCDPGNSNNTNPSNDEGPCNRGRSGKCN